jgi:hypothetical protein
MYDSQPSLQSYLLSTHENIQILAMGIWFIKKLQYVHISINQNMEILHVKNVKLIGT